MAKSMRSKREKRLRAIRRELVEPLYEKKDVAKVAALEAALAAPKLPVRPSPFSSDTTSSSSMKFTAATTTTSSMDVEMDEGSKSVFLQPVGGIGKKSKRKFKLGKVKRRGKGKLKLKRHI